MIDDLPTRRERLPPRVLVIDDEAPIRRTLERMLGAFGYGTIGAATAAEAIVRFEEWPPDVVLVDLKLPDMDGRELMARLAEIGPGVPMIVITGDHRAVVKGVVGCCRKPFDVHALVEMVGKTTHRAA